MQTLDQAAEETFLQFIGKLGEDLFITFQLEEDKYWLTIFQRPVPEMPDTENVHLVTLVTHPYPDFDFIHGICSADFYYSPKPVSILPKRYINREPHSDMDAVFVHKQRLITMDEEMQTEVAKCCSEFITHLQGYDLPELSRL